MILFCLALLGATFNGLPNESLGAGITFSGTIVESSSLAINSLDLDIDGMEAQKITVVYSDGLQNSGSREYLVVRRDLENAVLVQLESSGPTIQGNPKQVFAVDWKDARPILAALKQKRTHLAMMQLERKNKCSIVLLAKND